MDKWGMYIKIRQLYENGYSKSDVARELGISRTTVHEYLSRDADEMAIWVESTRSRAKKLDPYKNKLIEWLREYPSLSAAQVYDWIQEDTSIKVEVAESTVRNYVKDLRDKYHIPKEKNKRVYEAIEEPPMGKQVQVDFGSKTVEKTTGQNIKLHFIAFVLSHSRYKYVDWLDRPFTTRDVVRSHENAFEAFKGIPHELVYDQDSLIVVNENAGDIIYTKEFESYRQERNFKIHVCRKSDPESKGKVENVVGFIKNNFANCRKYHNLAKWQEQSDAWLERTGNGKVHNTTKKRPIEVFHSERKHLQPVLRKIELLPFSGSSISRTVRETIPYSTILIDILFL